MLHRHHLPPPQGDPFTVEQRAWWAGLPLSVLEQLQVRQDLALLESLTPLIKELEETLAHLSTDDPWARPMALLLQLPGVGLVTALTALAAIGDITRFPSAKKLVGYSGLGSSVSATGQTYRTGEITKQGRRDLRAVLVEAAWIAVEHHPLWKARFERLAARSGKKKAIVAVARKLLVVMWQVLTHQEADRYAEVEAVGRKFMKWGETHRTATYRGLSWAQFARNPLTVVGLGTDLETLISKGHRYALPAVASGSG
jgi:transposase